jgi:pimeloyl-ACP methyl ester carboxylesterase
MDDELLLFEAHGAPELPLATAQGRVEAAGAEIWYATYGKGAPVILLHGGLGHSGNWGYQVPALVAAGHRVVLIDTRGHGRSTRDARPFTYDLLASDVIAVMDTLGIEQSALIGWSDGACTSLVLARKCPSRCTGVLFFACNMAPSGVKPFEMTPLVARCFARHEKDYLRLCATPDDFTTFVGAVAAMQRAEPNYTAQDLASIAVPVTVVLGELDEFIRREHAEYLAQNIARARFVLLRGVSHFAPLQRPGAFNELLVTFLDELGDPSV